MLLHPCAACAGSVQVAMMATAIFCCTSGCSTVFFTSITEDGLQRRLSVVIHAWMLVVSLRPADCAGD